MLKTSAQNSLVNTTNSPHAKLSSIGLNDVQWTKGFWAERFAVCRDVMVPQLWATYTSDTICYSFENFKIAAGLDTGKFRGPSFHDGDFYKTLEAVAAMYASTKDKKLDAWMDNAIAVIGNPNPINGRHIHSAEFEPLWDAIEELGVPVGFHPTGQSSLRDDIARRYIDTPNGRVIGVAGRNPIELMMAFGSMAAGGVLERHPGLRCAFLEGTCGWLPWYLWRLDEAWEKFGPGSEIQISQTPSQYFFRQCYIATDADEKPLRQVVEAIGDDNIVVSTDYPHSDGLFPVAIEEFVRLEGVSDKTKSKILWDNCARLYKL